MFVLDTVLVGPLVSALHIHAVIDIGRGDQPQLGEVTVRALRVLPVVVAAVIASALMIALGFVALIVPGVLLALGWAVVAQVAAVDNDGWLPALRRSRELTRGHYGHIFGLLIITGTLSVAISGGAQAIPLGSTSGAASVALGIATRTITASFSALTLALLYFDLRARRRGASARGAARGSNDWSADGDADSGVAEESPEAGPAEEPPGSGAPEAGPDPDSTEQDPSAPG